MPSTDREVLDASSPTSGEIIAQLFALRRLMRLKRWRRAYHAADVLDALQSRPVGRREPRT